MKQENEFITLRIHSLEQALGLIDCLFDNGYNYKNYSEENTIRETVRFDITHMFKSKSTSKNKFNVYYVEIDNEIKEFVITTKKVDIVDLRADKIKRIQLDSGIRKNK